MTEVDILEAGLEHARRQLTDGEKRALRLAGEGPLFTCRGGWRRPQGLAVAARYTVRHLQQKGLLHEARAGGQVVMVITDFGISVLARVEARKRGKPAA